MGVLRQCMHPLLKSTILVWWLEAWLIRIAAQEWKRINLLMQTGYLRDSLMSSGHEVTFAWEIFLEKSEKSISWHLQRARCTRLRERLVFSLRVLWQVSITSYGTKLRSLKDQIQVRQWCLTMTWGLIRLQFSREFTFVFMHAIWVGWMGVDLLLA